MQKRWRQPQADGSAGRDDSRRSTRSVVVSVTVGSAVEQSRMTGRQQCVAVGWTCVA